MIIPRCLTLLILPFFIMLCAAGVASGKEKFNAEIDEPTYQLIKAVDADDPVKVLEALNHGANARIAHSKWGNLLHGVKSAAVLKLLIDYGADVNSRKRDGKTPLYKAVYKGRTEVVKTLLAAGADPFLVRHKSSKQLIHIAAEEGHLDVVRELLQVRGVRDSKDSDGVTALHAAAADGHAEVVALLLEYEADPNAAAKGLLTPLHVAKTAEIVKLLVEAGAYVDARNRKGATPLHFAVAEKRPAVLGALLKSGADVHALLNDGSSALALLDSETLAIYRLLNEYGIVPVDSVAPIAPVAPTARTPKKRVVR